MGTGSPGRLVASTRRVDSLDAATRAAMWELYARYYARVDEARFFADLDEKDDVVIVRDARDRSVQGFTTLRAYTQEVGGRRVRVVFSGDTVIATPYQGQSALQVAFVRYVVGLVVRHREPVWWFLISKGYKTYLLMSRNFLEYWPRHERATSADGQALIDGLARARFGDAYRPELGVVRFAPPGPRLIAGAAPLDPAAADRPDVRFFFAANPGWEDGDELCCVGRVDLAMALNYLARLAARVGRRVRGLLSGAPRT